MTTADESTTDGYSAPLLTSVQVVLRKHHAVEALTHVCHAISAYLDQSQRWNLLSARESGFMHLLRRRFIATHGLLGEAIVDDEEYRVLLQRNAMKRAAIRGDVNTLERLSAHMNNVSERFGGGFLVMLIHLAAEAGNLHVLQWLDGKYNDDIVWRPSALHIALHHGHFEVAKWLHDVKVVRGKGSIHVREFESETQQPSSTKSISMAILQWKKDNGYLDFKSSMKFAATLGRLDIMRWLIAQEATNHSVLAHAVTNAFHVAATHGHLQVIQWIYETYRCSTGTEEKTNAVVNIRDGAVWKRAIYYAAENGHLHVVKWLFQHLYQSSREDDPQTTEDPAEPTSFSDLVNTLDTHQVGICAAPIMNYAVRDGRLDLLQSVLSNHPNICATYAMDVAAQHGHLEMIQWLHANRQEGCTKKAMDGAAENGHLEVVKWLHTYRNEGCTSYAMVFAARNGHFEMLQWLHHHRPDAHSHEAIVWAAQQGHLDIVAWMCRNVELHSDWIRAAVHSAVEFEQLEVLVFLHEHARHVLCSKHNSVYFDWQTFEFAANGNHLIVMQWLTKHYRHLIDMKQLETYCGRRTESYQWLLRALN